MSKTEVSIDKSEKVIGLERSSSLSVEITGSKELVEGVEKAVRSAVAKRVDGGEKR